MGRWKKYLKPLAFVPAVFLFGGLIGYRTGVVQVAAEPDPQNEAQRSAATEQEESLPPRPQAENKAEVYLPGSKSLTLLGVGRTPPSQPAENSPSGESILASKLPKLRLPPWLQPSYLSRPEPPRPIMPSSKSFQPIPFNPQTPGRSVPLEPPTLPDGLTPVLPPPPAAP